MAADDLKQMIENIQNTVDILNQPVTPEQEQEIAELDPLPCKCGSFEFQITREPFSCSTKVECLSCGHAGDDGPYRWGAIMAWNEEMENNA